MQKLKNETKSVKIKIYEELIVQSNEKQTEKYRQQNRRLWAVHMHIIA